MSVENIRWAYKVLRSRSFLVLTDNEAAMNLPVVSLDSLSNVFLLSGQTAALQEFRDRLDEVIGEHEEAIKQLDAETEKAISRDVAATDKKKSRKSR